MNFHKEDRVVCIDARACHKQLEKGEIYTVECVNADGDLMLRGSVRYYWSARRFEAYVRLRLPGGRGLPEIRGRGRPKRIY